MSERGGEHPPPQWVYVLARVIACLELAPMKAQSTVRMGARLGRERLGGRLGGPPECWLASRYVQRRKKLCTKIPSALECMSGETKTCSLVHTQPSAFSKHVSHAVRVRARQHLHVLLQKENFAKCRSCCCWFCVERQQLDSVPCAHHQPDRWLGRGRGCPDGLLASRQKQRQFA